MTAATLARRLVRMATMTHQVRSRGTAMPTSPQVTSPETARRGPTVMRNSARMAKDKRRRMNAIQSSRTNVATCRNMTFRHPTAYARSREAGRTAVPTTAEARIATSAKRLWTSSMVSNLTAGWTGSCTAGRLPSVMGHTPGRPPDTRDRSPGCPAKALSRRVSLQLAGLDPPQALFRPRTWTSKPAAVQSAWSRKLRVSKSTCF